MSTGRGYPRDPGLAARMLFVMFLLGLLYVAVMAGMFAAGINPAAVLLIAGGLLFAQYYFSSKIALFSMKAREVSPAEAPQLHGIVDRLCALADMPKPRVAIADSDVPNAFATGRSPKDAVVCATTGIMRRLEPAELEAVLAHELSHVAHRDVAVMTIAGFLGVVAGFITRSMFWFGPGMTGGHRDNDRENNAFLQWVVILVVSIVVYTISFILTRALSRYRELSADRGAAVITGSPSTLASALVKVTGAMGRIPTRDLRAAEAFNAFFFSPAAAPGFSISSLFSTHPTLERRLEQLAELERQMGRPV
ncbi:MAG TPA: zinc metalloprotease HtpX [Acidimicrobiia bacterium]|nr:zinc metalloprotease HtpX [Acidimicrobiia bacterium]